MKTLIVEDDVLIRLSYECQLRALKWEYTSCADAETALAVYQQAFYPLILTDVGLPEMDGIEFCRRVRAFPHGMSSIIVIISGNTTQENIRAARAAGADEFLPKPVNLARLPAQIAALASKSAAGQDAPKHGEWYRGHEGKSAYEHLQEQPHNLSGGEPCISAH